MEKKKNFSNKKQLNKLISLMENVPDIAKGVIKKSEASVHWAKYAAELNSLGPPIKTPEKWSKVWVDLKFKTKKKLTENKKELKATGGGPNTLHGFSPLEESIINLINLEVCTDPPGREFGLEPNDLLNEISDYGDIFENYGFNNDDPSLNKNNEKTNNTTEMPNESAKRPLIENNDNIDNTTEIPTKRAKKTLTKGERDKEMSEHINNVENFNSELKKEVTSMRKQMEELNGYMKGIYEYSKKRYYIDKDIIKLKEEKFKMEKEEMKNKQMARVSKLKIKAELLEIKRKQCHINLTG